MAVKNRDALTLLPKELEKQLPTLEEMDKQDDPMCLVKIFNPCGAGTWWVAAKDEDNPDILFGVAEIFERELGSFSLSELKSVRVPPFGLPLERDLYYKPRPLSDVLERGNI